MFLLLAILSLILLLVDIFFNGVIKNIIPGEIFTIIAICILGISIVYFLVVVIWWEIVDYNELKFNKNEKMKLKQLQQVIKKENNKRK